METAKIETRSEGSVKLELSRQGEVYQVRQQGRLIAASDWRGAEKPLVELALAPLVDRDDATVLLSGLHMGFAARALLDSPAVVRVDVIEPFESWIDWEGRYFAALNGDIRKDSKLHIHHQDFLSFAKNRPGHLAEGMAAGWFAVVIDEDVAKTGAAEGMLGADGLVWLEGLLRPGGVLTIWSSERNPALMQRLSGRFQNVAEVLTPVDLGQDSELRYVYRVRRAAASSSAAN